MNNLLLLLIIVITATTRLIPHPPNFTPIIAICLFSGAFFKNRIVAFVVPLGAMIISDLFLGLHVTLYWVYGSVLLVVILGILLNDKINLKRYLLAGFGGSILFFIITNFGVWITSSFYPKNLYGIIYCYIMALPFFVNTLISSLLYISVMFGFYNLVKNNFSEYIFDSLKK